MLNLKLTIMKTYKGKAIFQNKERWNIKIEAENHKKARNEAINKAKIIAKFHNTKIKFFTLKLIK